MSNDKVWVVLHVGAPTEPRPEKGFESIAAIFSSVTDANMYSKKRYWLTQVVGPITVQQPKAAEIQAKNEQLQRALVKQLEKEQDHE